MLIILILSTASQIIVKASVIIILIISVYEVLVNRCMVTPSLAFPHQKKIPAPEAYNHVNNKRHHQICPSHHLFIFPTTK